MKRIKQVSDKQAVLNAELKIVSNEIRAEFDSCQCCNAYDSNRGTDYGHQVAHIISRRVKKFFSDKRNLLLLCIKCHKKLDAYKTYELYKINKGIVKYIINWLGVNGELKRADKLSLSLKKSLDEYNSTYDPREFQEDGNEKRSTSQNDGYWGNTIGQYTYHKACCYQIKTLHEGKLKCLTSNELKRLGDKIHIELKKNVLPMFNVASTQDLNTSNWAEYIANCFVYFGEVLSLDIYEYGEKPKKG